jgi:hypothetical protein
MSPTRLLGAAATAALPLAAAACVFSASVLMPESSGEQGGAGGGGGAGPASTSSSGGGQRCDASGACDDGNSCTTDGCNLTTHACYHTKLNGSVEAIDDNNPCTEDSCNDGSVQHTKLPIGQSCGLNVVCNDAGHCVECLTEDQCPAAPECQAPACSNFRCDVENVLVDTPCSTGKCDGNGACVECLGNGDCHGSDVCADGKCLPSNCKNGNEDGLETDIDCGGLVCAKCAAGKACILNSDCLSNQCTGDICG